MSDQSPGVKRPLLTRVRARIARDSSRVAHAATSRLAGLLGYQMVPADVPYYYHYNAFKKIRLEAVAGFAELAEVVLRDERTFLRHDRLYTLWTLISQMRQLQGALVEVGAFRGGSAKFIAECLPQFGMTNRFYVFDTFTGHAVVDPSLDGRHAVGAFGAETSYESVRDYLSDCQNTEVVPGDIRETSARVPDQVLLAHVDVDVYPITKFCLELLKDRVVCGGAIVVDDFGFTTCPGAKQAVEEFLERRPGYRLLHQLTGQGVLVRFR